MADSDRKFMMLTAGALGGAAVLVVLLVVLLVSGGEDAPAPPAPPPPAPPPEYTAPPVAPSTPALEVRRGDLPPAPIAEAAPAAAPTSTDALPADLIRRVKEEVLTLPSFYLVRLAPPDTRKRLDRLLAEGKGTTADAQFLERLAAGPELRAAREELAWIAQKYAKTEAEAAAERPPDRITLQDGTTLDGRIAGETQTEIQLERRMGQLAGVRTISRYLVKEIGKGKGLAAEFDARWAVAVKQTDRERLELVEWCKQKSLPLSALLAALLILKDDPGHPAARHEAGLGLAARAERPRIVHQGRVWEPAELKAELLAQGYVLSNGGWHTRKRVAISVPSLPEYEKADSRPVIINAMSGASLCWETEVTYKNVFEGQQFREVPEEKRIRCFYGAPLAIETQHTGTKTLGDRDLWTQADAGRPEPGAQLVAEVQVMVPVGSPILEASVKLAADLRSGGTMTVFLNDKGKRVQLYGAMGKEESLHKIDSAARGRTELEFIAVLRSTAAYDAKVEKRVLVPVRKDVEKRGMDIIHNRLIPEYRAMLFPSSPKTVEVFRLEASIVGDADPYLDRLFIDADARDLLR
jgi:hypothetical protein